MTFIDEILPIAVSDAGQSPLDESIRRKRTGGDHASKQNSYIYN